MAKKQKSSAENCDNTAVENCNNSTSSASKKKSSK